MNGKSKDEANEISSLAFMLAHMKMEDDLPLRQDEVNSLQVIIVRNGLQLWPLEMQKNAGYT